VPGKDLPKITDANGNPINPGDPIPPGAKIDVSGNAAIDLTDPNGQDMIFFGQPDGVPTVFIYLGIKDGVVQLALVDGTTSSSRKVSALGSKPKPPKKPKKQKPKKPLVRLWGAGKGHFAAKGKYASAEVRGTIWLIADYPDHTLVTVKRGVVAVVNFVTHRTTLVTAGHSIIVYAKPKPAKPKPATRPKKPKKK
jgi:hypothetical protein